jgi:hypothetical protein
MSFVTFRFSLLLMRPRLQGRLTRGSPGHVPSPQTGALLGALGQPLGQLDLVSTLDLHNLLNGSINRSGCSGFNL